MDARDRREANKPIIKRVKNKPNFEQREFVNNACEILCNTWEYHIDYGPLMFHFKENIKAWDDYCTVTISSKQFNVPPFKLINTEWESEFYSYPEAFFAVQDFIESLQYENQVDLPERSYN